MLVWRVGVKVVIRCLLGDGGAAIVVVVMALASVEEWIDGMSNTLFVARGRSRRREVARQVAPKAPCGSSQRRRRPPQVSDQDINHWMSCVLRRVPVRSSSGSFRHAAAPNAFPARCPFRLYRSAMVNAATLTSGRALRYESSLPAQEHPHEGNGRHPT